MGDFGQLPPVGDKPMYVSRNGTVVSDHGHSLYLMFESVIILDQVMRQAGEDPEAVAFRALVMRMRNGEVTEEDWKLLLEHSTTSVPMDQWLLNTITRSYCSLDNLLLKFRQSILVMVPVRLHRPKLVDWTLFCFYPQKQK
jgi:hypothetical protein